VGRYDQGAPYDGISNEETLQRHDQLAQELSPGDYQQAAQGSFANLFDEERTQVGQQLASQAQAQGIGDGTQFDAAAQGNASIMGELAGLLHQQSPGMLGSLLGGGGQAGNGELAGIVANAARSFLG
jgi:hypothetical protein